MPVTSNVQLPVEVSFIGASASGPEVSPADVVGETVKGAVELRLWQGLLEAEFKAVPEQGGGALGGGFL